MKAFIKVLCLSIVIGFSSMNSYAQQKLYHIQPRVEEPSSTEGYTKIFLAGTIDMGNSVDWQRETVKYLEGKKGNYIVFNPRRDEFKNTPEEMEYQVKWELDHLEQSDMIIMNLLGSSKSPISLLELGIHIRSGKLRVACPKEYYRYDNVRITCEKYNVPIYDSLEELLSAQDFK